VKSEHFHAVFDSIEDFIDTAAKHQQYGEYGAWGGGLTWEEIEQYAHNGWPEGAQRAERMRLDIIDRLGSLGLEGLDQVENYDVSGAFVDVGAFCEGEPECMVEYDEQVMPNQRVARIYVQINYLSRVTPAQAERRGVAIAAIVDALEAHGMQCEIWAVDHTCNSRTDRDDGTATHGVLVKKAGQLLPLDRIAFAIGHPSFYRGASFSVRGSLWKYQNGVTRDVPPEWIDEGDLLIPAMIAEDPWWQSDDAAVDWVSARVAEFMERSMV
jgi:hypothetical protein